MHEETLIETAIYLTGLQKNRWSGTVGLTSEVIEGRCDTAYPELYYYPAAQIACSGHLFM